jgi:hypothetical protein
MSDRKDESPQSAEDRPANRREFLGRAAATAVAVSGVSTLLAACGESATGPTDAKAQTPAAQTPRFSLAGGKDPGVTLHLQMAATLGQSTDTKIPALEKGTTTTYIQRVVTDNDRTGTALATVLKSSYKFTDTAGTTVQVIVQNSLGTRWAPRKIGVQSDLAYAMKDALINNTLAYGVLNVSLTAGNPVVAVINAAVIQYQDGVASDYYGNHNDIAARGFSDVFNATVAGYPVASTTRDVRRC